MFTLTRRELLGRLAGCLIPLSFTAISPVFQARAEKIGRNSRKEERMELPQPRIEGKISLEKTIKNRRTVRSFASEHLTLEQFSQLFWAAQGTTDDRGFKRAAPSAGAMYPMDVYAVVGADGVESLKAGIYHYEPQGHAALLESEGDFRNEVARASLSQMWMVRSPVLFVITAQYDRITIKYGKRGVRYAMIEAGHMGQNIFLNAEALDLGAGIVGAFDDKKVNRIMKIPRLHEPLLIMPVGYKM